MRRYIDIITESLPQDVVQATPEVHNRLTEDAKLDLSHQTEAQDIAQAFGEWMAQKNEVEPLNAVDGVQYFRLGKQYAYSVRATDFGLPEKYSDLRIGFAQKLPGQITDAALVKGRYDRRNIYFVIIYVEDDPGPRKDLIFGMRWEELIHELTHYLDRRRQKTPTRGEMGGMMRAAQSAKGPDHYYNHSLEFNAFFQQGMYHVMTFVQRGPEQSVRKAMSNFEEFRSRFVSDFDYTFRKHLTKERKRRFEKRLFALYEFLSERWQQMRKKPEVVESVLGRSKPLFELKVFKGTNDAWATHGRISEFTFYQYPTVEELFTLCKKSHHRELRGIITPPDFREAIIWWKAEEGLHIDACRALGIPGGGSSDEERRDKLKFLYRHGEYEIECHITRLTHPEIKKLLDAGVKAKTYER